MAPSVDAVGLGNCSGYHVAAFSVDLDFSFWSQPSAVRSGQKASTCAKLRLFLGAGVFRVVTFRLVESGLE